MAIGTDDRFQKILENGAFGCFGTGKDKKQLAMYLWKNACLFIINLKTLQQSLNFMPWKPI
ncbi:hypothetical protein OC25_09215 [Pedobacter kyungheensis]|uniref:Uncharacterized protein n=1 Tax=Pedobacter kyungheensis TaxID=1069985 RepID=A0A0C1G366_9SPHI|nr:hypothetical protein OC25_09215 [Pedobacter kyungheensis]